MTDQRSADPICRDHEKLDALIDEAIKLQEDYDPTPWCTQCGAKRQADCTCGPIADNN